MTFVPNMLNSTKTILAAKKDVFPFCSNETRHTPGTPDIKMTDFPTPQTSGVNAVARTANLDVEENVKFKVVSAIEPCFGAEYTIV